ncbi:hypothetical protein MUK42_08491 [Musa troglodytarum]|uniref:Uncharacterized protein n=1 Tax=Musa troglodytarum TaxID=320322 RepID=A0A9E7G875_9LILI|nr:hypothetical protein MUK42_08491 [Musa troglodytarum]
MAAAAMTTTIISRCPLLHSIGQRSPTVIPAAPLGPSFIRFFRRSTSQFRLVCMASSAAENPYESGHENRKRKDAEQRRDEVYAAKLEKAYDRIMMSQLQNRKKGLTFGSFKVSRDIKYADKQPIVSKDIKYADKQPIVSWGPRYSRSNVKDVRLNMAISAVFEYGEDEGKGLLMGRRILRALPLVFHCIAVSSLGHTGLLNLIEFLGRATPLSCLFPWQHQSHSASLPRTTGDRAIKPAAAVRAMSSEPRRQKGQHSKAIVTRTIMNPTDAMRSTIVSADMGDVISDISPTQADTKLS